MVPLPECNKGTRELIRARGSCFLRYFFPKCKSIYEGVSVCRMVGPTPSDVDGESDGDGAMVMVMVSQMLRVIMDW